MAEERTPNNLAKYTFALIAISLAINFLFIGFLVSSEINWSTVTEEALYTSTTLSNTGLSQLMVALGILDYDPEDLSALGEDDSGLDNKFDRLMNLASGITKLISFLLLGGVYASLQIFKYTDNLFLSFLSAIFLIGANAIWFIMIWRLLFKREI